MPSCFPGWPDHLHRHHQCMNDEESGIKVESLFTTSLAFDVIFLSHSMEM